MSLFKKKITIKASDRLEHQPTGDPRAGQYLTHARSHITRTAISDSGKPISYLESSFLTAHGLTKRAKKPSSKEKRHLEILTYLFYGKVNCTSKPSVRKISILKRWIYKRSQTQIDFFPFVTLMNDYKSK